MISNWAIYANGEPWELLNGGPISYYSARIFLTNKSILTADGPIPPRTLGLTISRSIGGGLHEDLEITNNSMKPVRFQLEVAFRCDFADVFEIKSDRKSTRLNSSHTVISYAVFCLKKKKTKSPCRH